LNDYSSAIFWLMMLEFSLNPKKDWPE